MAPFYDRGIGAITILDGGMGRELHRIGAPFRQPEWSALALMESPDFVRRAHQNFIDAGADVITTNAYACVPFHLGQELYAERAEELVALAARIARDVAQASDRPVLVAGSLPPLFGSYQPELFQPDKAAAMYQMTVQAQEPFVDLWLGETLSLIDEFNAVSAATADSDKPLWASFCLPDEAQPAGPVIRSGEPVAAVAEAAAQRCEAILFNCSRPEVIGAALGDLAEALGSAEVRTGAYANAFEAEHGEGYSARTALLNRRDDLSGVAYADIAEQWIAFGASIVGGCCGIHPEQISVLSQRFRSSR